MVCDQVEESQIERELEALQKEELAQTEARHRMVMTGILATQSGNNPEITEMRVREAAAEVKRI